MWETIHAYGSISSMVGLAISAIGGLAWIWRRQSEKRRESQVAFDSIASELKEHASTATKRQDLAVVINHLAADERQNELTTLPNTYVTFSICALLVLAKPHLPANSILEYVFIPVLLFGLLLYYFYRQSSVLRKKYRKLVLQIWKEKAKVNEIRNL